MSQVLAIAVLAFAPVGAEAGEWWQGNWAWDKAWCKDAARIGSVTPAPIAITPTEVLGYENSCAIVEAHELRDLSATRLRLECRSEGDVFEDSRLLMWDGENAGDAAIWIWSGAGEPLKFHRCPDPDATMDGLNRK